MPEAVHNALKAHKVAQDKERLLLGESYKDHGLVFPAIGGTPMEPRNLVRHFKGLLKKAGLPDMRFHDLRHSCATLLLMQGVPVKIVSDLLGHSSTTITQDIYSHVLRQMQDQAAAAMDSLLASTTHQKRKKGPARLAGLSLNLHQICTI